MTTRVRNTVWAAAWMIAGALPVLAQDSPHTKIPLSQVKEEVTSKKAVLVDVREPAEWEKGHIEGAVLLPLTKLRAWEKDGLTEADKAELFKVLPKGSVVYTHCGAGARAVPGGEALRKFGYDARPLKPGYKAIVEAGFPDAKVKPR